MNTPAHLLIGVALCGRRDVPGTGRMAVLGSLLPDLSLYVLASVSLFVLKIPPQRVFDELYFSPAWQAVFAVDNSIVIWGALFAFGVVAGKALVLALAGGGLLHVVSDFLLHNDDARRHFWPLTDWVFESPLSYWDSQHHAAWVAPVTLLAVLASAVVIWRRWPRWVVRGLVFVGCCAELWVVRQWLLFF